MTARGALLIAILTAAAPLAAQQESAITEERVREVVTWLASDERQGRDSPSPGLDAAADWLQQQFEAAGLRPGVGDGYRHRYTLPCQRVDSRRLVVTIHGSEVADVELRGDADVRLYRPAATPTGEQRRGALVRSGDARFERSLQMGGGRRVMLLEVPAEHPLWVQSAGVRDLSTRRLRGSSPIFLVRNGTLPDLGGADEDALEVSWKGAVSEPVDARLTNVVAVLEGTDAPLEYVVVSAHYDHIGIRPPVDGDAICNGADDDASGTTAVVLLAEALAKGPKLRRSVAFVCFSAEEKGLRGSAALVADPPFPLDGIVANVNIEMIGRPMPGNERAAWITGSEYSDFAAIIEPALLRADIRLVEFGASTMLFSQSDNLSFARHGVVAHSISAGSLHEDYHQPSDEVEKLDLPHMTAVIRGLEQAVRELADRAEPPAYNEKGQAVIERLRDR